MRKGASGAEWGSDDKPVNPKKRSFPRFSLRRLLHPNPLIARRILSVATPQQCSAQSGITVSNHAGENTADAKVNLEVRPGEDHGSNKPTVTSDPAKSDGLIECSLCLSEFAPEYFPQLLTCPHRSCYDCFQVYLKIEISESRVSVSCPQCSEPMHPNDIRMILNDKVQFEKYEDFMVRRVLAVDPDTRWCPAPDCCYAVVAAGCASCPKIKCGRPGCGSYFCYHCKAAWHPNQTCDDARAQRSPNVRSSSLSFSQDSQHREVLKPCPRCQALIMKMEDGSCNHMICALCGAEFCWLCMKEVSDLHYLSPSGCTFWGKKPWSRKKKILWQLGTLVGAPVGIGLVAGIAVPAIIIGIPVWVGRKLYTRYEHANRHKRNLAIAGGVSASVIISPILASLAVGIGVPILLFYVYGVVPVSLCRSGGCGVSTSATGVRFDFDDENDVMVLTNKTSEPDAVSHPGGNPSIGEASLSLGSGSHLDREVDRESGSFVALAGSIASNTIAQRLEVLADVVASQRFSVSSETASAVTSLSDKSVADDGGASTRGLAGSFLNYKMDNGSLTNFRGASNDSSTCNEATASGDNASQWSAEPISISSLEELTSGTYRKSTRKSKLKEDCEESSSERVRFDSHVSYIDPEVTHKRYSPRKDDPSTSKQEFETSSATSSSEKCDDSTSKSNASSISIKIDNDNISLAETSDSVSSLEEVTNSLLKKCSRKSKGPKDDTDEYPSERVRFDNHVSYIDREPLSRSVSTLRSLFFQSGGGVSPASAVASDHRSSPPSDGSSNLASLPTIPESLHSDSVTITMP